MSCIVVCPESNRRLCKDNKWRSFAMFGTSDSCVKIYKYEKSALNAGERFAIVKLNPKRVAKVIHLHEGDYMDASGRVYRKNGQDEVARLYKRALDFADTLPEAVREEWLQILEAFKDNEAMVFYAKAPNSSDHLYLVYVQIVANHFREFIFREDENEEEKMEWAVKNSQPLNPSNKNVVPYNLEVVTAQYLARYFFERFR